MAAGAVTERSALKNRHLKTVCDKLFHNKIGTGDDGGVAASVKYINAATQKPGKSI